MQNLNVFVGSFLLAAAPGAFAATLDAIPMQGGMVMPMISYHSGDGSLHVMMDATIPELTPLLVSNPGDSFDPEHPWFEALDPAGEGRSFSRRYGFAMDANTDLLPPDQEIWIRKLSSSDGLSVHRYSNGAPSVFEPIFGTEGTTNAIPWNGMMFHPVFSAPAGTNAHTATFEAYLVNTATGVEVPDSSTGPFVFNWTNVPGRPGLQIEPGPVVTWPASAAGYELEWSAAAANGTWAAVTNASSVEDERFRVALEADGARKFFRLRLAQ